MCHPVCKRSPPPSCDACPAPAHVAQHDAPPCCGPLGRGRPSPGRSGFRGAWSRARRPGGWPMENVDVRCHVSSGMLRPMRATKKRPWTSPLCRRLPVCAVSGGVESAARSGSSCSCVWCCDRTIVYRRYAIAGSAQTSSPLWWCPAIALRLSRALHFSHFVTRHIWRRRGVSPLHCRAHGLQRGELPQCLCVPMYTTFDRLPTARN